MRITKVNSTNFKGLWEVRQTGEGWSEKRRCLVFFEDNIYHPFKNETNREVEAVMRQVRKHSIYKYQNGKVDAPFVTVIKYKEGNRLNITQEQYNLIQCLQERPNPQSEHFKPLDANN